MGTRTNLTGTNNDAKFQVECHAGDAGGLKVRTNSLSVCIGQRVRRNGSEEMWDSVIVRCDEGADGSLTANVIVCHPDWDEPLQIASIQSRPQNGARHAPILEVDMKHHDA